MSRLTVVIPVRDEPLAVHTIRRAWATAGEPIDVLAVLDGPQHLRHDWPTAPEGCHFAVHAHPVQVGNCYCRDYSIINARTDAILLLDAHMNWRDNDPWAARMVQWLEQDRTRVSCFVMVSLPASNLDIDQPGVSRYYGARIGFTDRDSDLRYNVFPVKWASDDTVKARAAAGKATEIQCVLGGAYLLSRQRYLAIGRPWAHSLGWGTSEQTISAVNAMCDGSQWIYPLEIGHVHKSWGNGHRVEQHLLYHNQLRLLEMMPVPDADRARMLAHHTRNDPRRYNPEALVAALNRQPWPRYGTPEKWQAWADRWKMDWYQEERAK